MRTVTEIWIERDCLVPKVDADSDEAALDLIRTLLREERVLSPEDRPLVNLELLQAGFEELRNRASDKARLPNEPESADIAEAAVAAVKSQGDQIPEFVVGAGAAIGFDEYLKRQDRALKHGIALLAQIPADKIEEELLGLRDVVYDRDNEVFGLLFQHGLTFVIRLRHRDRNILRAATERLVNALAPRAASQLGETVRKTKLVDKMSGGLRLSFKSIFMLTPAGELAQTGHVHVIRSQAGLLSSLAIRTPQLYLVFLTAVLAAGDLVFKLGIVFDWTLRGLSLGSWFADFLARLSSGAFAAYLVALFIKYGEVRKNLRGSARQGIRAKIPGGAFGAYIEWKTD